MLTIFVVDLLITELSDEIADRARNNLMATFALTDVGNVSRMLGIGINRDSGNQPSSSRELHHLHAQALQHEQLQTSTYSWSWKKAYITT